jgi:hypothetical protein
LASQWKQQLACAKRTQLARLAAFIAQQFPKQNLFEDTDFKKSKVVMLDRQALTLSRLQE